MTLIKQNSFSGPWRIVWMSGWDQDYVDMDLPGHITFQAGHSGSFQFGLVRADLDYRLLDQPNLRVEFSWEGDDEGDDITGRGYAELLDGELHGHFFIHLGDDSAFRAVRQTL